MPLSALGPEGPISLVGMDLASLESLKQRIREERCFFAKCCGAPVQVRTAVGRIPHFVHTTTPENCDGERGESQEHLDLKLSVASAAINTGWDVELEAAERGSDGALIWRADVLARKGRARVAFEIELSRPDWNHMRERQERYSKSGVRGLWLVKTKKAFPARRELPIFSISHDAQGRWVDFAGEWDWPGIWGHTEDQGSIELKDFIDCALTKQLRWAPLAKNSTHMLCNVSVRALGIGECSGCGRAVARPSSVSISLLLDQNYPRFLWHHNMPPFKRSYWVSELVDVAAKELSESSKFAFVKADEKTCGACGDKTRIGYGWSMTPFEKKLSLRLGDLTKPRFGTIEYDWINRWIIQRHDIF